MKFTNPEITLELLKSMDIIASSSEDDVTVPQGPQETTLNNDPYENDKW